jgi:hypothetical protein
MILSNTTKLLSPLGVVLAVVVVVVVAHLSAPRGS